MSKRKPWKQLAPKLIYDSYPDSDLLPWGPPKAVERVSDYKSRVKRDGCDPLFEFLCGEACDDINAEEYVRRLNMAIRDIEAVRKVFEELAEQEEMERMTRGTSEPG